MEISKEQITSPSSFLGNFGGYIRKVKEDLEAAFEDDPGEYETVAERAGARAPFIAAQRWLIERWGEHYPCPVCDNVEWAVTEIAPSEIAGGVYAFYVVCNYCGNAMRCVPGYAERNAPQVLDNEPPFPEPNR
jgi:hypothetical protein